MEFHAQSNMPVPAPDVDPNETRCKRLKEAMKHHKVPFMICWENLSEVKESKCHYWWSKTNTLEA